MDITRRTLTRRREKHVGGRRWVKLRLAAVFIGLLLLAVLITNHLHPILDAYGKNRAQWLSSQVINEAVTQVLSDEKLGYADLVAVSWDEEGAVKAVEADVGKINRLKAEVADTVLDKLKEYSVLNLRVPLGTLFGGEWFNGWGPQVPLRISVSGSALAAIHSAFTGAGINQTSHQITMELTSNIVLAFTGYTTSVEVKSNFLVAETVLVGKVPDSYTEVDGSQADAWGKIFAYGGESK